MSTAIQTIIKNEYIHYYRKTSYSKGGYYKKVEYFYDILNKENILESFHHREKEPAVVEYSNNKIKRVEYWYKGKRHRRYGPAIINLINNKSNTEEWYIEGEKLSDIEVDNIKKSIDRKRKILNIRYKKYLKSLNQPL